jgi:hypothetical protein
VHLRSSRLGGAPRIEHGRQRFIVHRDRPAGLLGDCDRVGNHRSHPLPPEPHDVVEHQRVIRVVEAVLVPGGGKRDRWGVAMGEHGVHPQRRLGGGGVDRADPGVRVRASQHRDVQQPGRRGVERVGLAPGDDAAPGRCR